jgi:putative transposase
MTQQLSSKIVEIALARRRFGYRRIHDLLRPEFPGVNHKRVYRLYSAADLAVRKRRKAKRPINERVPLQAAATVNEVWSMDFVSDSLSTGRRIKCLTVGDDFSHECVDISADWGISGQYVTRLLDRAALFRGYPSAVRTDNGPEFTSRAFMANKRYSLSLIPLGKVSPVRSTPEQHVDIVNCPCSFLHDCVASTVCMRSRVIAQPTKRSQGCV